MIWLIVALGALAVILGAALGVVLVGEFSERTAVVLAVLFVAAMVVAVAPLWSESTGELLR